MSATVESLDGIAARYGTDKGTQHAGRMTRKGRLAPKRYTLSYERFLGPQRLEPLALLEIGIDRGASLRMWEDYLPNARIAGIDMKRRCRKYASERSRVFIGSQTDPAFLESVATEVGPFDVIVDDGGHTMEQHLISLTTLWKHVKPGGVYFIEDLRAAYFTEFGGGYLSSSSTIERLKVMIDALHGHGDGMVDGVEGMWLAPSVAGLIKA